MVFSVIFHVLVIVLGPFIFGDMMGMLERAVTVLVEVRDLEAEKQRSVKDGRGRGFKA